MKWLLTIILAWLSIPGYVRASLLVILIGILLLAATPHVRRSWLVRAGFILFLVGFVPLVVVGVFITDNPIGLGFLFALLTPISMLMIISGTVVALMTNRA